MSMVIFLPAARSVWVNRHDPHAMRSASLGMNGVIVVNALLWIAYAVVTRAWWVGASSVVNLPLAALSAHLILRARRLDREASAEGVEDLAAQRQQA